MDIERIRNQVLTPAPAPLHQRLREAIREQILDGTLPAGAALPSERTMKEHFGVSRATVRQAVNALIQDGFLQSIAGTGTFVLEQAPKPTMTGLIGLITSSTNFNFFYPELTAAFNQRIREAGYGLVISLHNEHTRSLDQLVNELLDQNVVAMAITPPRYGDMTAILARLRQQQIPVICIGRNTPLEGVDIIATDNEAIGYQATQHLIECGHKQIVYIGLLDYSTGSERAAGYQRAMREAGLQPYIEQLSDPSNDGMEISHSGAPREHMAGPAYEKAHQIWGQGHTLPRPTAAFCFNDIAAMGVYKGLREIGLGIPDAVSIVSVDNLITVRHFEVPLTTFALPGEKIGIRSAELLLRRLSGDRALARRVLLPAEFIPRASTRSCS